MQDTWMLLTDSMNAGAHGHIRELLDGTWSSYWSGFYNRTEEIVLPFVHTILPLMEYLWRADYLQCKTTYELQRLVGGLQVCTLSAEAVAGQTPSEDKHDNSTLPGSKHRPVEIVERASSRPTFAGARKATPGC
ncbi:hypothetical protein Esi_0046_0119 [Ectocarpus siliculosus]|uniref:Uncharacterized protein n=1 Tax=Ectocarpus siliculosus TaxID=2880 RepID=D7G1Z8_ECTSI|nr:hypothetical protein Esi_0046_0119 [Ectocarpus siliculosus]|eukprot:CBJ48724.1 hypothetical protein Esi_0046_0119 [Ectocarpus siliculosus]